MSGILSFLSSGNVPDHQGMDSDGFFELEEMPARVVVVGAGYIAVELAGIFQALGSKTSLVIRHENFLRTFDEVRMRTSSLMSRVLSD